MDYIIIMSNKPKVKLKTIQLEYKGNQKKILNNMMIISKNIYNCCIYTNNIFSIYKNQIYKIIYDELNIIKKKYKKTYQDKIRKYDIINRFLELFKQYYVFYSSNKELIKINNNIIFEYVKNKINNNIILNNSNIEQFINNIKNNINVDYNDNNKFLVFDEVLLKIVKYFYNKFYLKTKDELIHHKPLSYNDAELIKNVKNNEYYFEDIITKYKTKIIEDFKLTIKSDQTIFKDIVYGYGLGVNKEKLPADITLNLIDKYYEAIKSYYAKLELKMKAKKPKYLDKNSKFSLFYYASSFRIENNKTRLTIGKYHSYNFNEYQHNKLYKINHRKYCDESNIISKISCKKKKLFLKIDKGYIYKKKIIDTNYIYFKLPNKIKNNNIKMIQVKPYGNKIMININYEEIIKNKIDTSEKCNYMNSISIDPGINNLLTIYNPTGTQHIIKGTKLKSINEFYNKKIAELQSINKKLYNNPNFNRLYSLLNERKNKINGELNNIINLLVNTYNNKLYFIMGYNESWKTKVNLGSKTNRIFYSIPYQRIIEKLKTKLESLGKELIIKEESYTSKCDSLNLEDLKKQDNYDGIRKHRGLFISKTGKAINADLNGAINIMRKVIKLKNIHGLRLYNPTKLA